MEKLLRSTSVARIYLLIRPKVSFTTTFKVKWVVGFVPENSNFAMCMDQGGVYCCPFFQKGVPTQQRLAVLLATKIFDRVRKEKEEASGW